MGLYQLGSTGGGTPGDDSISNTQLANMAQATIKGRQAGAGTGDPEDLSASQARTALGLGTTDSPTFANVSTSSNGHITVLDSGAFRITGTGTTNHIAFSGVGNWYGQVAMFELNRGIVATFGPFCSFSTPVQIPSFTVSTVPSVASYVRCIIYVTDESGGATLAFCDGTNWRRVTDRAIIS